MSRTGGGVIDEKAIVQVFVSLDGKSFSIIAVTSTGAACLVAAGCDWQPGENPQGRGF